MNGRIVRLIRSKAGCLALERRLPERVRRTAAPEPLAVTPLAPAVDLAADRS